MQEVDAKYDLILGRSCILLLQSLPILLLQQIQHHRFPYVVTSSGTSQIRVDRVYGPLICFRWLERAITMQLAEMQ